MHKEPVPEKTEPAEEQEAQTNGEDDAAKEREARAQASIKEREREVQRALATSLRDRDKEREFHKRDEAVQHFNALLADLVRNPDLSWREAKKQLRKDHRYTLADLLSKEDKERLFAQHTSRAAARPPTPAPRRWSANSAITSGTNRAQRRPRCGNCCRRRGASRTAATRSAATARPRCSPYTPRCSTTPGTRRWSTSRASAPP
ncbi:hypothetical protein ACJJTC_010804 [Scirpophaga incertulas]